jgi:large subunit ribosomal protein L18
MAKGTIYRVAFRRRREGKTDYHLRKKLISSRKLRLVVRRSINNINLQLIESTIEGDKVLAHAGTGELNSFGWKAGTGNLPAAYLAGFLVGKRAVAKGLKYAILDLNRYKLTRENRLFAAMKGAVDGGLEIPHDEKVLPKGNRINGSHIAKHADLLQKEDPAKYQSYFAKYISSGVSPEKLVEHYTEVKDAITKKVK